MDMKKITAIIRYVDLEKVEMRLRDLGIGGFNISKVKGYGEYANFSRTDWKVSHARLEIFTEQSKVDEIITAIMETAHSGAAGDGIVAVLPVEKTYRIRTKSEVTSGDL